MSDPEQIIDPPVGPYDLPAAIQAWLDELDQMEPTPDVQAAIEQAQEWLDDVGRRN